MFAPITDSKMKKMTKVDMINLLHRIDISSINYQDCPDTLSDMTKFEIRDILNKDIMIANLIEEAELASGICQECIRTGSEEQLRDFIERAIKFKEESKDSHPEIPGLNLKETSLVIQSSEKTSWMSPTTREDCIIIMVLYKEVFPSIDNQELGSSERKVLSTVCTLIKAILKIDVPFDQLLSPEYIKGTEQVLRGREWNEEDKEVVAQLIAKIEDGKSEAFKESVEIYTAPCDTALEGITYDARSVVCQYCPDLEECSKYFSQVQAQAKESRVTKVRAKKDAFENPSAMTMVIMQVVHQPEISKEEVIDNLRNEDVKMPSESSVAQAIFETHKHLRVYGMLGLLTEEYVARIPKARRDIFANPSSVTQVAILCAQYRDSDFDYILNLCQNLEKPISKDAVYYQYQDSQKVHRLLKSQGGNAFINKIEG